MNKELWRGVPYIVVRRALFLQEEGVLSLCQRPVAVNVSRRVTPFRPLICEYHGHRGTIQAGPNAWTGSVVTNGSPKLIHLRAVPVRSRYHRSNFAVHRASSGNDLVPRVHPVVRGDEGKDLTLVDNGT